MTITKKGAWFTKGYRRGMVGTLGGSLDSDSDNLGWALRSWKYELAYNGHQGAMVLDSPYFGDAAIHQIREFQTAAGIGADGVIGPVTARHLLRRRITNCAAAYLLKPQIVWGIVSHESTFDIGAIGWVDLGDRGPTQKHLSVNGTATLSQAIRPAWSILALASFLSRVSASLDESAAIAGWNIGEGGAEWWYNAGEPTHGSPSWWDGTTDLSERATAYVAAVRQDGSTY